MTYNLFRDNTTSSYVISWMHLFHRHPGLHEELTKLVQRCFPPPHWDNTALIVTVGSQNALHGVLDMIMEVGDPIVIPGPCYSSALSIVWKTVIFPLLLFQRVEIDWNILSQYQIYVLIDGPLLPNLLVRSRGLWRDGAFCSSLRSSEMVWELLSSESSKWEWKGQEWLEKTKGKILLIVL